MNTDIDKLLEDLEFWPSLSEPERETVKKCSVMTVYKKGQFVHSGGEHCTGLIYVLSGQLRVYLLSDEGREVTLYRIDKGELCVLSASCVLQSITFDVFIEAEEDCGVLVINAAVFKELSRKNLRLENFLLTQTVNRFSDVMWTMQQILFKSMDKRLASFLYDEAIKTGADVITLTHEQIAKYIGSAREVVTRVLKYFVAERLVELSRNEIKIIDKQALFEKAK